MKSKFCICSHHNYPTFRTAIEAKILFAVCVIKKQALTGGKILACEDKCSKKIGAESAVFNFVFFVMLKNKIEQSAAQSCLNKKLSLSKIPTDRTFENRRSRYKELGKKVPQAYRVYVEDTFLPCDAVDAHIFSKEHDVYGIDYGFDLEPPEDDPANLEGGISTGSGIQGGYRRDYTWNERNLLVKSDDKLNTVIYRYGEDGQRALKFTQQSNNETLYFNNFYSVHQVAHEPNHEHGLRVSKHIFVGNSRLVTAMTHANNNGDTIEQNEKRYYYHQITYKVHSL